jgi:uncharacterized protein with HEPN domain
MLPPEERDPAYLWEIHRAAREAETYAGQVSADEVVHNDGPACYAISNVLERLGRFAGKLSAGFRATHPEVDWAWLASFERGLRLEDELHPDCERIWNAMQNDLPGVADAVERLIPPLPEEVEDWAQEYESAV